MIGDETDNARMLTRCVQWGVSLGVNTAGQAMTGYLAGHALAALLIYPRIEEIHATSPEPMRGAAEEEAPGGDLERAFREALCEALYDVGGQPCFRGLPARRWLGVPMEAVFPLSGGRNLWHVRDPRTREICRLLHSWVEAQREAGAGIPEDTSGVSETWPAAARLDEMGRAFFERLVHRNTAGGDEALPDFPLFETHLQRWAFERTWARLGERLGDPACSDAWRIFCGLLLAGVDDLIEEKAPPAFAEFIESAGSGRLSATLAQLIARSGALRKTSAERIDEVFLRVVTEG